MFIPTVKNIKKSIFMNILIVLLFSFYFISCNGNSKNENGKGVTGHVDWTIMIYADGDNDLESFLMTDIEEMKEGYINGQGLNLIVMIDRIPGFSADRNVLNENFTDTRLYHITNNKAKRTGGGLEYPEITKTSNHEANMGDLDTLKKFINFCKNNFPADHYALILWNHGDGARSKGNNDNHDSNTHNKAICYDDSDGGDALYCAEITDCLTGDESVDFLGFDACFMGSVEVAYQYRPGNDDFNAQIMVASPPEEWGYGWSYDQILKRIRSGGGNNRETDSVVGGLENFYDPAYMTAQQLGLIILEEQYDSTANAKSEAMSCYDLSKVNAVKEAVDTLAISLYNKDKKKDIEVIRGSYPYQSPNTIHYFNPYDQNDWIMYPFFDLYDLCSNILKSDNFNSTLKRNATAVMNAVDNMIINSFANYHYNGFLNGKNGIHIFLPNGDNTINGNLTHWAYQWWYNSINTNDVYGKGFYYGNLSWCCNGATPHNNGVENWFEMLDAWFDPLNDASGGVNAYQW